MADAAGEWRCGPLSGASHSRLSHTLVSALAQLLQASSLLNQVQDRHSQLRVSQRVSLGVYFSSGSLWRWEVGEWVDVTGRGRCKV